MPLRPAKPAGWVQVCQLADPQNPRVDLYPHLTLIWFSSVTAFASVLMSDGEAYSSPLYEPSQLDEEVRLKRIAEMPPDQFAEYKALRRAKRIRHGQSPTSSAIPSPSSSPGKPHSKDDPPTPRASVMASRGLLFDLYAPGGALDSQIGSQTFVDRLCGYQDNEGESEQEYGHGESQLETEDHDDAAPRIKRENSEAFMETQYSENDHEQELQIEILRTRTAAVVRERDEAIRERDEALQELDKERKERSEYQGKVREQCALWFHERKQLSAELNIWRNAAQAAAQIPRHSE
ncbi:hypothetical protein GGX14DRAFT_562352 [Mycena pura]|uniref:Uncharacterized protein n=1 Tax=Mycena pura TaxID=153505 RepID=A0AAD6VKU2_9AGAR|nr:hypothetical protein GGX14DRAFT_562352 [Mycena pura]